MVLGEGGGVLKVGFSHKLGNDDRAGYVGIRWRKRLLRVVRRPIH